MREETDFGVENYQNSSRIIKIIETLRVIASTDSNQFDGRFFAMEKLYCRANKRVVAKYFELYFAIHHQWLIVTRGERGGYKG